MSLKFRNLTGLFMSVVAATGCSAIIAFGGAKSAIAQPEVIYNPVADSFNEAYFANDRDFFTNRSLGRQLEWIFGISGFSENEIDRDTKLVDQLYKVTLDRQVSSDPILRTRDLPNPYETSVLTSPRIEVNTQTSQEVETIPEPQPEVITPEPSPVPPVTPNETETESEGNVRALW